MLLHRNVSRLYRYVDRYVFFRSMDLLFMWILSVDIKLLSFRGHEACSTFLS